jgi:hypothetical protein
MFSKRQATRGVVNFYIAGVITRDHAIGSQVLKNSNLIKFSSQTLLPRLPDGIFVYQKSRFWYILEGLKNESYGYMICLRIFGIFCGLVLVYWTQKKSGKPCCDPKKMI